ncbi:hypothetical protein BN2475_310152 [Paraburkholderia ribeironis]|uniref:Uncharacterized protein n=1 Tax=Paraburkholderia ribeironis TaxID=1247936 RepID=A0A1N7S2Q1_9BURK|nr:hypothetical protein BN2475_310152 [Paraburkholderia ribeironis]
MRAETLLFGDMQGAGLSAPCERDGEAATKLKYRSAILNGAMSAMREEQVAFRCWLTYLFHASKKMPFSRRLNGIEPCRRALHGLSRSA